MRALPVARVQAERSTSARRRRPRCAVVAGKLARVSLVCSSSGWLDAWSSAGTLVSWWRHARRKQVLFMARAIADAETAWCGPRREEHQRMAIEGSVLSGPAASASMTGTADEKQPARMSVSGAAFLGIGAMVGAGIFALLGEAGAVAGAAVWLSFLLAGVVAGLLGYAIVKLGVRFPSSGGIIAYLVEGFGNGRLVGIASWLGYMSAIVIVCLDGVRVVRQLRHVAVHRRRRRTGVGQRLHDGHGPRRAGHQRRRLEHRRPGAVGHRHRAARGLRGLHRRDPARRRLGPAGLRRLPRRLGHRRERRADLLRLPGLQRDHVRGRRPRRPGARVAQGHVRVAGRDRDPLRPRRAGRLRHAHGRPRSSATARRPSPRRRAPCSATPASS